MRRHFELGRKLAWLMTAAVPAVVMVSAGFAGAQALPSGGKVTSGTAVISTAGTSTTIAQSSGKAILTWNDFSIGQGDSVQFNNGSGATLNRVTGGNLSSIDGLLSATGSVYLINPNGVVIGKSGVVKTGGSFVASTLDVGDSSFLAGGDLSFSGHSTASVVNLGSVGSLGGNVVLIGSTVENDGSITAANGTAGLVAGQTVLMKDTATDQGLFTVQVGGANTTITNTGTIAAASAELRANGGSIYALAGNTTGIITATGVGTQDGHIWLTAGNAGTLSVDETLKATQANGDGGTVETSAGTVDFDGVKVDTTGTSGKTGQWLVDPFNLAVNDTAAATISSNLATTNVTLQTFSNGVSGTGTQSSGAGDILIEGNISWSSGNTLTLNAYHSIDIYQNIVVAGAGKLVLDTGNGGDYGFGLNYIVPSGVSITFTGTPGGGQTLTINGNTYTLLYSMSDVAAASGYVALANSIDASGATYSHSVLPTFSGTFAGLGNQIDNLTIDSNDTYVGFTGQNTGTIRDLDLVGANIFGTNYATGAFAGWSSGAINQSLLENSTVGGGGSFVAGLVGINQYGTMTGDYTNATVSSAAWAVGGVAGWNSGVISGIGETGATINGSGTVTGGMVGYNDIGFVENSTMTNNIVSASGEAAGELIGWNRGYVAGNLIENYAPSAGVNYSLISTASHTGGLIGVNVLGNDTNGGRVVNNVVVDSITANGAGVSAGGLVGWNSGILANDTIGPFGDNPVFGPASEYQLGVTSNAAAVGGVVGWNQGTLGDDYIYEVNVTANNPLSHVGGMVGGNASNGEISSSFVLNLVVSGSATSMGGMVGWNAGDAIYDVASNLTILQPSLGFNYVGGFAGVNTGTIEYSSSGGSSVTSYGVAAGGFVGDNRGSIYKSEASTPVVSNYYYGGFAGMNEGTISTSYWATDASRLANGVGLDSNASTTTLTGLTSSQLAAIILY